MIYDDIMLYKFPRSFRLVSIQTEYFQIDRGGQPSGHERLTSPTYERSAYPKGAMLFHLFGGGMCGVWLIWYTFLVAIIP